MSFKWRGGRVRMGLALGTALLSGCEEAEIPSGYATTPLNVKARIQAEFTAGRSDGDGREFKTVTEAWIRLRRAGSMNAVSRMFLEVDSIRYASAERDEKESAFMRERLKKYRADWRVDRNGHVSEMREEPELPRGDLTFRLGPGLAAALPVFSASPADTQSLFDPSEPGAVLVQGKSDPNRKSCELKWPGAGAMTGTLDFKMDEKLGFPSSVKLDVKGALPAGADSGTAAAPAEMRFRYAFKVTGSPQSP